MGKLTGDQQSYSRSYLETKDDGPNETQGETVIPVHNIMWAHVFQMDFLLLEKLQGFVHILQAVNTHTAFGRPWLWEAEGKEALFKLLTKRNHTTFVHGPEG